MWIFVGVICKQTLSPLLINTPEEYLILSKSEFDTKGDIVIVPVYVFLALLERSVKNL